MKRLLLLFGLLVSFLGFSQSQNDADLTTQINSTIRGKVFLPKSHADMFKTIVDSKLNLNLTSNKTLNTGGFTFVINNGSGNIASFGSVFSQIQNSSGTTFMTIGAGLTLNSAASQAFVISQNSVSKIGVFASGAPFINVGSDATGDMLYRNSGLSLSRLAKGTEGTLLRAGASVPAYSGFTIPNTIGALSIFAANSANVLTAITPTAGQSIRVNAGGTAWEAYTPGGGGFTNGAAANELIKSDGTNGVASGIFSSSAGNLNFGNSSTGGSERVLSVSGSTITGIHMIFENRSENLNNRNFIFRNVSAETGFPVNLVAEHATDVNINFNIYAKGTGDMRRQARNWEFYSPTNQEQYRLSSTTDSNNNPVQINGGYYFSSGTFKHDFRIKANGGTVDANTGLDMIISGGNGYGVGNTNGGRVILEGGTPNGTGTEGAVVARYAGQLISMVLFEPVSETGTSFTFDYSHLSKLVVANNAGAITATVPALQVGYITKVVQDGAGTFSITAGANVVLVGKTSTTGPGDTIVIHAYKTSGSDTYYLCE